MPTSSSPEKSFLAALQSSLPAILPQFLMTQRWFGGKARTIRSLDVSDIIPFSSDTLRSYLILARIQYVDGGTETYDIPLVPASADNESSCLRVRPKELSGDIVLKDAMTDEQFLIHLLNAIATSACLPGAQGLVRMVPTSAFQSLLPSPQPPLTPSVMKAEQSNTSVVYEKRLVLKIFRRVEEGLNPDLEIGSFLMEKSSFRNVPPLAGYMEYVSDAGIRMSLGMLQGYVANQGDAWQFTLKNLAEFYGKAPQWGNPGADETPRVPLLTLCRQPIPDEPRRRIGPYLESAALLGHRTAELHLALACATEDPDFRPQPFSETDRQAFVNSALQLLSANFALLRRLKDGMPDHIRREADSVLKFEEIVLSRFQSLARLKISAMVTRIHGDYHLGQVLFTGSDFIIIDFEGEPARPLEERRKRRSPLQDVAGMLRSFHYAAYAPLFQPANRDGTPQEELQILGNWAQYWQKWVSAAFLKAYFEVSANAIFIPESREELALLLHLYLLDKAVYELGYELNNRPTWVRIPLDGISQQLQVPVPRS
ncbi:MAG: putative maltokinase [Terriglobales bacterium]